MNIYDKPKPVTYWDDGVRVITSGASGIIGLEET